MGQVCYGKLYLGLQRSPHCYPQHALVTLVYIPVQPTSRVSICYILRHGSNVCQARVDNTEAVTLCCTLYRGTEKASFYDSELGFVTDIEAGTLVNDHEVGICHGLVRESVVDGAYLARPILTEHV
jgi:hypothetical protein